MLTVRGFNWPKITECSTSGLQLGTTLPFRSLWSRLMLELRAKWPWCSASTSSMPWSMRIWLVFSLISFRQRMRRSRGSKKSSMIPIWPWVNWRFCHQSLKKKCASFSCSLSRWNCCRRSSSHLMKASRCRWKRLSSLKYVRKWSASQQAFSTLDCRYCKITIRNMLVPMLISVLQWADWKLRMNLKSLHLTWLTN